MLWLALFCPTLTLDCILRRWPRGLEPAMAVSDLDGSRRFIAAATTAAQESGVFVGQSVATALAMRPDLAVVPRRLDDERRALVDAALALLRFTPNVALRPAGLVTELSGSLRLFGGRRALYRRIVATMRGQGLGIALGEGPTPQGAWLLAKADAWRRFEAARAAGRLVVARPAQAPTSRSSQALAARTSTAVPTAAPAFADALAAVPVGLLESLEPPYRRLTSLGIRRLVDLRRLPAAGIARRFGPALPDELDRAFGDKPDPQRFFVAPERFDARIELFARVETAEALVFAAERLIAQLCGWLAARRAAVREIVLVLHHERWSRDAIEPTRIPIALATPSSEPKRLGTLLRERLAPWELKAPVLELSLEAPAIVEEREAVGVLFPEREEAVDSLARLLEKLIARLGPDATARIERVADHRPERAWRTTPVEWSDAAIVATPARRSAGTASPSRTSSTIAASPSRSPSTIAASPSRSSSTIAAGASRSPSTTATSPSRSSSTPSTSLPTPRARPQTSKAVATTRSSTSPSANAANPSPPADDDVDTPERSGESDDPASSKNPARRSAPRHARSLAAARVVPPGPRPAWLLPEPRQLDVRADRPLYEALPLALVAGPERIESGWWDDATATRDYFIAENAAGHLVWIYRERLIQLDRPMWFLQGLFG